MYNKQHCQSCIRRVCDLKNSTTKVRIIVSGKHSFAWTVTIIKEETRKSLTFPTGRLAALKEYQRLQQQFKKFGDCNLAI